MKHALPLMLLIAACGEQPAPPERPDPMELLAPPEHTAPVPYAEPLRDTDQTASVRIPPMEEAITIPEPQPQPQPSPDTYSRYLPEAQPKTPFQNERIGPPTIEERYNRQDPWSDTLPTPNDENPPASF